MVEVNTCLVGRRIARVETALTVKRQTRFEGYHHQQRGEKVLHNIDIIWVLQNDDMQS